jgi:flavodoxin
VETVARVMRDQGLEVVLHRSEQTPVTVIQENDLFILATSTWEHGVLNPFFKRLFDEMKTVSLANKKAAFIGLGDTRYEPVLFNGGVKQIHKHWLKNGGLQVGGMLLINGEPYHLLDGEVTGWAREMAKHFLAGEASSHPTDSQSAPHTTPVTAPTMQGPTP